MTAIVGLGSSAQENSTQASAHTYRLGIDIGGTFTDAMLVNEQSGEVLIGKVPTTPSDPSQGFLAATERMLTKAGIGAEAIAYLIHATTIATNAIIEGKGARTGFITTQGFRDLLEIQRQVRPSLYDVMFDKTRPLVPRYLAFEVAERLSATGEVLLALDEDDVRRVARQLKAEKVEAVALCFLHAYRDARHEKRAVQILREELPDVAVSISSEVAPEFREYTRASTTVINASVRPIVRRYLRSIEERLRERGLTSELLMMQSSGGVFSFESAMEKPVFMVESGPAAGVIAAAHMGEVIGVKDIISFDMGGTTAKASLIRDGQPSVTKEYSVGVKASSGSGAARSAGYPINTPVVDLVEIGAGGGSIAWVDSGGVLRVGPQSAAADPAPACYSKGGTRPTVTDANLVLGRLDPEHFLGSEMQLDEEAARHAIEVHCAEPLGMDVVTAANGIVEIANAAMINALRLVSVQHGYDPREFTMMGFGGAGPLHANRLAAEMKIPQLVIPPSPGIFSAMGLLVTDLKHDFSVTRICEADQIDAQEFGTLCAHLLCQGKAALERDAVAEHDMSFNYWADMRYSGQSYELAVKLPEGDFSVETASRAVQQFHEEHHRAYGFNALSESVEFVNLRLTARGRLVKPRVRTLPEAGPEGAAPALAKYRSVYFEELGGYVECPLYLRGRLGAGAVIQGPALIVELDSMTVLHPAYDATVDEKGCLWIRPRETAHDGD
jgi:N-methylhydantoinase A